MLISKFDLYKHEWLELVFDDRNKNYGAYELRQHNSRTMLTAMAIAFLTIGGIAVLLEAVIKPVVAAIPPIIHVIPIESFKIIHPPALHPPSHAAHSAPAATHVLIHSAPVFVPTNAPVIAQPVKPTIAPPDPGIVSIDNTPGATGTEHTSGTGITTGTDGPGNGTGLVSDFKELARMPQPVGGASAWSRFLTKNINYPAMASDVHAQGAVWVSFIVEADGKLSNIKVLRGPGYGMDEEAVRVLKMAPAWIPGMQNGHTVRVYYTIPIRFTINDEN